MSIDDLRASGKAIIYISHRLEEIRRIGDRLTVLKDGRTVAADLPAHETPTTELITLMTGREVSGDLPRRTQPIPDVPPLLVVEGLGRDGEFDDVSFDVRPGEIVGLAGLVGAGRSEIVETVYGARRAHRGSVTVDGRPLRRGSVHAAVAAGLGLCPEERKSQGLVLDEAVYRNISLASLTRFSRLGATRDAAERGAAQEAARSVDLRPDDPDRLTRTLSGGNQQKIVLARWLLRTCRVLLLDEPTRGVDVGARSEIYQLIRTLADDGRRRRRRLQRHRRGARTVRPGPRRRRRPRRRCRRGDSLDAHAVLDRILATHEAADDPSTDHRPEGDVA